MHDRGKSVEKQHYPWFCATNQRIKTSRSRQKNYLVPIHFHEALTVFKNNDFIQQFLLFCVSLRDFTTIPQHVFVWCVCVCVHSSACSASGFYVRTLAPASAAADWHIRDRFIKLWLNHWCHINYFNDFFTTFLGLERVSCIAVYAGSVISRFS